MSNQLRHRFHDLNDSSSSSEDEEDYTNRSRRQRPELFYDRPKDLKDRFSLPADQGKRQDYMGKAAEAINAAVFHKNSEKIRNNYSAESHAIRQLPAEQRMDCVAISVSKDGKRGVISGNVKERDTYTRKHKTYSKFGLDEASHKDVILNTIKEQAPELRSVKFDVIGNTKTPTTREDNAKLHAEMQQVSYGIHGESSTMGVSKAPCTKCDDTLKDHGFIGTGYPEGQKNMNPKNWEAPELNNNPVVEKKFEIPRKKVFVENNLTTKSYTQVKTQKENVTSHLARNARGAMKPRVNASAQNMIETLVEDCDREPGAYAMGPNSGAGTYTGNRMPMWGAYARASTGDCQAHAGPSHVRANGPAASAGIHTSVVGVGAYANAELARAEASVAGITAGVGLNLNTGVSAGVDGVSASFLGFGVSVGPTMAIRTPVADASCCII